MRVGTEGEDRFGVGFVELDKNGAGGMELRKGNVRGSFARGQKKVGPTRISRSHFLRRQAV